MRPSRFEERTLALYKDFLGMIQLYANSYDWIYNEVMSTFKEDILPDYREDVKAIPVWDRECLLAQKLTEFTANLKVIFEAHVRGLEDAAGFKAPVTSKEDQNILLDKVLGPKSEEA